MLIRRNKKRVTIINDACIKTCIARFDSGAYSRLQFLRTASHYVGAHSSALCLDEDEGPDSNDSDEEATGNELERQNITPMAIQPLHEGTNDDSEVCLVRSVTQDWHSSHVAIIAFVKPV
jgi:hypothetical protein